MRVESSFLRAVFFGQAAEHAIIDRTNMHILLGHLRCAAAELPVLDREAERFGEYAPAILDLLAARHVHATVSLTGAFARANVALVRPARR